MSIKYSTNDSFFFGKLYSLIKCFIISKYACLHLSSFFDFINIRISFVDSGLYSEKVFLYFSNVLIIK